MIGGGWFGWTIWHSDSLSHQDTSSYSQMEEKQTARQKNEEKQTDTPRKTYTQEELKQKRKDDVQQYQQALNTQDSKKCQEIDNDYTRDQCHKKLAQEELDSIKCSSIENSSIKSSCLYFVYFHQALKQKEVAPCRNLPITSAQEQCMDRVKDRNFCSSEECYDEYIQ